MTYGERLKKARLSLELTQDELAQSIGLKNKQTISDVETNKQKKLMEKNEEILNGRYSVDLLWLQTGIGSMFLYDGDTVDDNGVVYDALPNDISVVVDMLKDMDKKKRRSVMRYVIDIDDDTGIKKS